MRSASKFVLPALVASLTLAACGSSSSSSKSSSQAGSTAATNAAAASGEATVKTAANKALGATILVDSHGITLYHLSGEENGKFICTPSACTGVWHPLTASGTPSGTVGSLTVVTRPDGSKQVAYKGLPLYTFVEDRASKT
jgi:predicted lipoprotein with Yx(FWY)xxD motif